MSFDQEQAENRRLSEVFVVYLSSDPGRLRFNQAERPVQIPRKTIMLLFVQPKIGKQTSSAFLCLCRGSSLTSMGRVYLYGARLQDRDNLFFPDIERFEIFVFPFSYVPITA